MDEVDNSTLLEEVFNEIETYEENQKKNCDKPKTCGFLEDILNYDKEVLSKNNINKKRKKLENKKTDEDTQLLEEVKSLIHEGLTDSSDDEDNKYFEEAKYNEYGKTVKKILKEKTEPKDNILIKSPKVEDSWKNSQIAKERLKMQLDKINGSSVTKSDLLVDPVFGMRIIKPLISSSVLKEKMLGRVGVGTLRIKKFLESPAAKESNWVTGGAVISKITRTSQKGNQYCVWNVSDLNGDIKTISVFLFGSAYKEYWKISVGTVVGVLNPVVMDGKDKVEATLRVDNAEKILLLGTSKDYGLCKSKKKNGENCLSVVNLGKCEYCIYHIKKEYTKACRRSDLQPPKIGRSLDNLRAKVLGKNEVFYGGKTFTAVGIKKSSNISQKDAQRLKSLSEKGPTTYSQQKKINGNVNPALINKDKDILSRLNGCKQTTQFSTPKSLLEIPKSPSVVSRSPVVVSKSPLNSPKTPLIMPKLPSNDESMIDLDFVVTKKDVSKAKANALKYIQKHGPIKKISDTDKTKRTPEQISSLKRKLEDKSDEESNKKLKSTNSAPKESNPVKEKMAKLGITDEFFKMMNSKVANEDIMKVAETEEREKYFNKLEMREKIEDKMASTFKIECKAVRCLKCNYKSFSASELCKKEKHPLKVVNAVKRFWKCGNCSSRTVCLELVPLHSCKTCGSSKWERASMMPEKKGPNLTVQPLSLRGNEEKFIGAVVKNASLNLLVPEEGS